MTTTATVPTDEQLKEYAAQLPDLYKDILAAYQFADPSRDRGEGLYEEQLQNFLLNELDRNRAYGIFVAPGGRWFGQTPTRSYRFSTAMSNYSEVTFSAAIDHLIENDFLKPRTSDVTGRIVPTDVGERLIETVAGKPPPAVKVPVLPKPTWR